MTTMPLYQIDAFTATPFKGNPAAVCLLDAPLPDAHMLDIAMEMNLSETAFVRRLDDAPWAECARFSLRWCTPKTEVRLCGHATLATAATLFQAIGARADALTFATLSGDLVARRAAEGIALDFPRRNPLPCEAPADVLAALGATSAVAAARGEYSHSLLLHLADADTVRALQPDFVALLKARGMRDCQGLMVTAAGDGDYDFISRYFGPWVGINEDPVTGSAHTVLTPYWAARLGKSEMRAYQASARGGELHVRLLGDNRVEIVGQAVVVFKGELYL